MQISGNFLSVKVWFPLNIISLFFLFLAFKKTAEELTEKQIPLLGVMVVFLFAIQLISFPLINGPEVHLVGVVLVSIIFGPWSGFLVGSFVLFIQALFFNQDSFLALGTNILNMVLIGSFLGWHFFKFLKIRFSENFSLFLAGFFTIIVGIIVLFLELMISGKVYTFLDFLKIIGIYFLIAIGEGFLTLIFYKLFKNLLGKRFPELFSKIE